MTMVYKHENEGKLDEKDYLCATCFGSGLITFSLQLK